MTKDVKCKTTIKEKIDKTKQKAIDEPTSSTKTIFKRTALEEKLIAFSHSADEFSSDSDGDGVTQPKENKEIDAGVCKVANSVVLKNNKEGEIEGSDCYASTSGEPADVTQLEGTSEKEVVEKRSETVQNDILPCSKIQTVTGDTNKQHNLEGKKSSSKQEEALPKPIRQDVFHNPELADIDVTENHEGFKDVVEKLKGDKDDKSNDKKLHKASESTESKEDKELGTMIEDLQKYGTGMDIEVKTKKESSKSEIKKVKKEKTKIEPPKLTDVNFFSVDVSKQNKKSSKEEKTPVKKDEKSESPSKDKKKLKKKLSESKLATTKEKSKIQRYKELKKLVKDSEKNVQSVSGENSGKTDSKETNSLGNDSKKKLCTTTNSSKVSASGKGESPDKTTRNKISKEPGRVLNEEGNATNKELKRKHSLKKPSIVADPGMGDVVVSSDSERSTAETKTSNVLESDMDNNMEDDSEENELLRIFNDYDPDNDEPDVMDSRDIHQMSIDLKDKSDDRIQTLPKSIAGLKRPSTESIPVGFKKPRIAHQPNLVSACVYCTFIV